VSAPRHVRRAIVLRAARDRAAGTSRSAPQRLREVILMRDVLAGPMRSTTDIAAHRAVTR
jgi:hypothetical protein